MTVFILLLVIPALAVADCQCVQPNEGQSGFSAATCTEPAYYYFECLDCGGQWKVKGADALGHDWSQCGYTVPTCVKEGANHYQCTRCLAEKSETIPATGHQWEYTFDENGRVESILLRAENVPEE